ncbi:phosphodiesterase [Escherichia coli]
MKLMFASDIHGSLPATERVLELFAQSGAQWLVILGDVLNHGPRNALPEGYAPAKVAERLNEVAHKVIAVRGNCDSEVDAIAAAFPDNRAVATGITGKTTSVFDAWSSFWPGKSTCFKPERCAGVRSYPILPVAEQRGGDFPFQLYRTIEYLKGNNAKEVVAYSINDVFDNRTR